ncbi:transposase [Streptomyces ambofaciens]|uniref:transposase n=1 Tax=Streptomyces ambofaciens TaxID=1889 RepID=UPI00099E23BF
MRTSIGDCTSFSTATHLASYAGLASTTEPSGTQVDGEHVARAPVPRRHSHRMTNTDSATLKNGTEAFDRVMTEMCECP